MMENKFYTKGDRDSTIKRMDQVHTITIYCPINDEGMVNLRNCFQMLLDSYKLDDNNWIKVPAVDALRCFIFTKTLSKNIDMNYMDIVVSTLKTFIRLKYITFKFTDDENVEKSYFDIINKNKEGFKNYIYKLDVLEFNLSDMFSQEVIDQFNKVMVINEIIPNEYLKRVFEIDFTYDEYISFMDMFLGNYGPALHQRDNNICDYFRTFPSLVDEHKPDIKIITNYSEL